MTQSSAKQKALEKARGYFEYANAHPIITGWREEAIENYGFYDGTKQWDDYHRKILEERGQPVVVINKIKSRVNRMMGMEIQSRYRIGFRSHLRDDAPKQAVAKALTDYGYFFQERNDVPARASLKFKDALITGLGWSNFYKDGEKLCYEYVNPLNILFDPDDLSLDLSEMSFVCRVRWYPLEMAKQLWPKHKQYFDTLFTESPTSGHHGNIGGELAARMQNYIDLYTSGKGDASKVQVVEVQYKRSKTCYYGTDSQGLTFETFDEDVALEMAAKSDIKEKDATQIMRVNFTAEVLLDFTPLHPNVPNMSDFTYIPFVWHRRFEDAVPTGWMEVMKDPQRELNYRRAKFIGDMNSKRVIVNPNAFPGKSAEDIVAIYQTNGVLFADPSGVKVEDGSALAPGQLNLLQMVNREMEDVTGISDDLMGEKTNAVSGIAIKSRQQSSLKNHVAAFDAFKTMKKREGKLLLCLIQGQWVSLLESEIIAPEDREAFLSIAVKQDKNGNHFISNDIRTIPLDIYVEETLDVESTFEEERDMLNGLLANPNAPLLMTSTALLQRYGFRNAEQLAQEMKQATQPQAPIPQGGDPNQPTQPGSTDVLQSAP